ncbi:MAG: hypothetical protein D6775_06625 [Caldilineae bacterium]|nr:MAG: hypothetical protein D6775_06625 [Caldilineae bacterium]
MSARTTAISGLYLCAAALALLLVVLAQPRVLYGQPPTGLFIEQFRNYDHADGARTTAWWDTGSGRLTLRPADADYRRRWPALAATAAGDAAVVWVEDRGGGPDIWAQHLDPYGNRLLADDRLLAAWQGDPTILPEDAHLLALAGPAAGVYLLFWSDESGVWWLRWSPEEDMVSTPVQLANTPATELRARCLGLRCLLSEQRPTGTELRFLAADGSTTTTLDFPGTVQAAWDGPDTAWVAWGGEGQEIRLMPYDDNGVPRRQQPLPVSPANGSAAGLEDIAVTPEAVWLVQPRPWTVLGVNRDNGQVLQSWRMADNNPAAMRLAVNWPRLTLAWQSSDPSALWAAWPDVSGIGEPMPRLLRLGLPGQEPLLADIAAAGDHAFILAWSENGQVYVRRWQVDGWSSWRHEVAPGYATAGGWVVPEGLGHSLEVNAPWEAVLSVRLEADVATQGGSVQFFVSNQGPRAWLPIQPGQQILFEKPGTQLRWYARLRRSAWGTAPEVREVRLSYSYRRVHYLPRALRPTGGAARE